MLVSRFLTGGAAGGGLTYSVKSAIKGEQWDARKFVGNSIGGGVGAMVGGFFGPGSGTLAKESPYLKQKATEIGMNFAGGVSSEALTAWISGEGTNLRKVAVAGITSAGFSQISVAKPVNATNLNHASWTTPSTLHGMFNGVQAFRMWKGSGQSALISAGNDILFGDMLKGE